MSRIRVLQVLPNFGQGGGERVALHLMQGFDPRSVEQAAVSLYDEVSAELAPALERLEVPLHFLGKKKGPDPRMVWRFDRVVRDFRPHVVHTHRYVLRYCLPSLVLRRTPARVHTVHNPALREVDRAGRLVHRLAFAAGVVPVAIARAVEESLHAVYGRREYPLIPNGVSVSELRSSPEARDAWRRGHGFAADDVLLVTLGRLESQKNQSLMLRAFARALEAGHEGHLLLAGGGPLEADLAREASRLELGDRVHFLGFRDDVPALLGASDAFVLSSDWEGNPLSVMEAMAAGLAIVSTVAGGVPELVDEGVSGLLVERGDVDALATAFGGILADRELRQRLGAGAARRAEERFDVSVMVAAYERLYRHLLSPGGEA